MNKEQEFVISEAWKALLFSVEQAIENIKDEVDRLEVQLEIEDRQVQRALEERREEPILT